MPNRELTIKDCDQKILEFWLASKEDAFNEIVCYEQVDRWLDQRLHLMEEQGIAVVSS